VPGVTSIDSASILPIRNFDRRYEAFAFFFRQYNRVARKKAGKIGLREARGSALIHKVSITARPYTTFS